MKFARFRHLMLNEEADSVSLGVGVQHIDTRKQVGNEGFQFNALAWITETDLKIEENTHCKYSSRS